MTRSTSLIALLAILTACTDSPITSPFGSPRPFPEQPEDGLQTVRGTVVSETELRSHDDGSIIRLMGPQTALLSGLIDAEIRLLGAVDEIGATPLWIVEFRVLAMDGLPALDGTFFESEEGFGIYSDEGVLTPVKQVPEELMEHVGSRVWLTTYDGMCVRFGVLEM